MNNDIFKPKTDIELKRDTLTYIKNKIPKFYITRKTNNDESALIIGKELANDYLYKVLKKLNFSFVNKGEALIVGYVFINRAWRYSYWNKDGFFIFAINQENYKTSFEINKNNDFNINKISIEELKKLKRYSKFFYF